MRMVASPARLRGCGILAALAAVLLTFPVSGHAAGGDRARYAESKGAPVPENPDAEPGEILVRFRDGRADTVLADIEKSAGVKAFGKKKFQRSPWHRVYVKSRGKLKQIVEAYREHPDVLYAEPNYRIRLSAMPDDADFGDLWGMHNTGQTGGDIDADIDAPEAWDLATDSEIVVAVIDSAVEHDHPDLAGNIWINQAEIPGNGIDDDSNGYIDDIRGWDFEGDDNDASDGHYHGTHVAGTIGAVGSNGVNVAGVCWSVKIMPAKFIGALGWGSTADAIDAIEYATAMGAKVLNNSWGSDSYSVALRDAVEDAGNQGVLFVAAAGNDGRNADATAHYPSGYDLSNIISVAASTHTDELADFSNYGSNTVDLAAPGDDIMSTLPPSGSGELSGTSMATPHVAGACALVYAIGGPGLTHMDIKAAVLGGVDAIPAMTNKCVTGGRLNLLTSMQIVSTNRNLHLSSPGGWYGYETGCSMDVVWASRGELWTNTDTVAIEYSADGGSNWSGIVGASNLAHDTGTFVWDTTGLPVDTQYLVRVSYEADTNITDQSDALFRIVGPLDHFAFTMTSPQVTGRPTTGSAWLRAEDSNGWIIATFESFGTAGRFPITVVGSNVTVSGLSGDGTELMASNFVNGCADLVPMELTITASNAPTTTRFTATSLDGKTGTTEEVEIIEVPDYFTERFTSSSFDLAGRSLVFIPNGSLDHYACYYEPISDLPVDPTGGTVIPPNFLSFTEVVVSNDNVSFYGKSYSNFFIGTTGFLTFEVGDISASDSEWAHFYKPPRLSALTDLFDPDENGQITWKELPDRAVVTYEEIVHWTKDETNTFQVELYFDGRLVISYTEIGASGCLAGLSRGHEATPLDYIASDLSSYPLLPGRLLRVLAPNGGESFTTGASVQVSWTHYGTNWQGGDLVELAYSYDSGSNWVPITGASNLAYGAGTYAWDTTGLATGTYYRVQAALVSDPQVADESDGDFSLVPDRYLTLLTPNGGGAYSPGVTVEVSWVATGSKWTPGDTVRLDQSLNGGGSWQVIPGADALVYDIGSFDWDTTCEPPGGDRMVRVQWTADSTVYDVSDAAFFFPGIYYVNDDLLTNDEWCTAIGSDSNSGLSAAAPKESVIDVIASYDLGPGDIVRIDTGHYTEPGEIQVLEDDEGNSAMPVTFEASPYGVEFEGLGYDIWIIEGSHVAVRTVAGTGHPAVPERSMRLTHGDYGVHLSYATDITLDRICIAENDWEGAYVESCANVTIDRCDILSNGWEGVYVYLCKGLTLANTLITSNQGDGVFAWYVPDSIIESNHVDTTEFYAMEIWDSPDTVLRGNETFGGLWGIEIWDSPGFLVENNLIVSNEYGLDIWGCPGLQVINNTLVDSEGFLLCCDCDAIVRNNIFVARGEGVYALDFYDDNVQSDYNLFYLTDGAYMGYGPDEALTLVEWRDLTGQDLHSLARDPLFIDPGARDYHVQSTAGSYHDGSWIADASNSPCIDTGYGDAGDEPEANSSPWHTSVHGARNMGAYGGTYQASKTPVARSVLLYEPVGRELYLDQQIPIDVRWTWVGTGWASNDTLQLDYSTNSGASWQGIAGAATVPVIAGIYSWAIDGITPSLQARVHAECNEDAGAFDESFPDFRIGGPFTWYVNDTSTVNDTWCSGFGNDANIGISADMPKATVMSVLTEYNLEPGDRIRIDTGLYKLTNDIMIGESQSGSASNPVVIEGSPNGVTLDRGTSGVVSDRVLEIYGADYLLIRTAPGEETPATTQRWMRLTKGSYGVFLGSGTWNCTLERLEIVSNTLGGVYHTSGEELLLRNNLIAWNDGNGVDVRNGTASIENNTISRNSHDQINAVQFCDGLVIRGNIVHADGSLDYGINCLASNELVWSDYNLFHVTNGAYVGYMDGLRSDLPSWQSGTGLDPNSLETDPLFVGGAEGDFHLQSTAGSFHNGAWTTDPENSPAIDMGDPSDAFSGEPAWNGGVVNLGAYANTEQASKSADTDSDLLSDIFELWRFGSLVDDPDSDDDDMSDYGEYIAGTVPLNPTSRLVFTSTSVESNSTIVIQWQSASNRLYCLSRTTSLVSGDFIPVASNIVSTPPVNSYTDSVGGVDRGFYRVMPSIP